MAINLETPVVTPSTTSVTYGEVWLSRMDIQAFDANQPVRINAVLSPARTLADGSKELNHAADIHINIEDFFAEASAEDISIMVSLIMKLKERARV
jgi:hypothetical protein